MHFVVAVTTQHVRCVCSEPQNASRCDEKDFTSYGVSFKIDPEAKFDLKKKMKLGRWHNNLEHSGERKGN